jgi:hypothetical protein
MICPKCIRENNKDAFFCENCGQQLKTRIEIWWFCAAALLVAVIFAIAYYNKFESQSSRNNQLYSENQQLKNEKQTLTEETQSKISNLADENRRQTREIENKNDEIANLKTQLPQSYYTKYSKQYLYNKCAGKYTKADCWFQNSGAKVTIYRQEDGYGLTSVGGWLPMHSLEKY